MDVLHQGPWGEVKTHWVPAASTTRCQSTPSESGPLACVKLRLASVQLQPAQSGSKQIHKSFVYTLTWAFPIRSWERFCERRLTDATCATVSDGKKELLYVCVWYYHVHRWESCSGRQRPDYDEFVWCIRSLPWFIAQDDPLIDWSMSWLIKGEWDWPVTQGGGHLPGRRSCWKLYWMFRCFVCAVRSSPGSPESRKRFRGQRRGMESVGRNKKKSLIIDQMQKRAD